MDDIRIHAIWATVCILLTMLALDGEVATVTAAATVAGLATVIGFVVGRTKE